MEIWNAIYGMFRTLQGSRKKVFRLLKLKKYFVHKYYFTTEIYEPAKMSTIHLSHAPGAFNWRVFDFLVPRKEEKKHNLIGESEMFLEFIFITYFKTRLRKFQIEILWVW